MADISGGMSFKDAHVKVQLLRTTTLEPTRQQNVVEPKAQLGEATGVGVRCESLVLLF